VWCILILVYERFMAIFGVFHGFFGFLVCVSSLFVAYDEVFLCCFCYWCDWMGFCRGFGRYFILVVAFGWRYIPGYSWIFWCIGW
jgi:hypothetical protein